MIGHTPHSEHTSRASCLGGKVRLRTGDDTVRIQHRAFPSALTELSERTCSTCRESYGSQVCLDGPCILREKLQVNQTSVQDSHTSTVGYSTPDSAQPDPGSWGIRLFGRPLKDIKQNLSLEPKLATFWNLIESKFADDKLSLNRAARVCGMSRTSLNAHLTKRIGLSFLQALVRYRLLRAVEYLGYPGFSIVEISELTGFGSLSSFYRHFRNHFSCSPGRHRKYLSSASPCGLRKSTQAPWQDWEDRHKPNRHDQR